MVNEDNIAKIAKECGLDVPKVTAKLFVKFANRIAAAQIDECNKYLATRPDGVWANTVILRNGGQCEPCARFFSRYACNQPLECDCPQCQGYCECNQN